MYGKHTHIKPKLRTYFINAINDFLISSVLEQKAATHKGEILMAITQG